MCLCVPVNERVRQIEKIRRNAVHDTFYGYVFSFSYALQLHTLTHLAILTHPHTATFTSTHTHSHLHTHSNTFANSLCHLHTHARTSNLSSSFASRKIGNKNSHDEKFCKVLSRCFLGIQFEVSQETDQTGRKLRSLQMFNLLNNIFQSRHQTFNYKSIRIKPNQVFKSFR